MYDFIGDIHGYGDELEALLIKLGYEKKDGAYAHPTRKAFFLGDFIDRGPKIKKTLKIVRGMIEQGYAKSVMANHEFNLICLLHKGDNGNFLREPSMKNIKQVASTFDQLTLEELEDYAKWFETLPLWHEEEGFRVAHACWDQKAIDVLQKELNGNLITLELLKKKYVKGSPLYDAIELVLKGPEAPLKDGGTFLDGDNHPRSEVRVAWWDENLVVAEKKLQGKIKREDVKYSFNPPSGKPVFFGHYWLNGNQPFVTSPKAQCLDFSVAKGGILAAYRFDGESEIHPEKFEFVLSGK